MRNTLFITAVIMSLLTACSTVSKKETTKTSKPNIVYILADDLGYGDLSCYGQKHFKTPNIDKLASRGMMFTQHYSGSTVCAPSRSALMTGLHTGHTPIRGNKEMEGEGQAPIPSQSYTIAEMLKTAGYVTGAFGKWGIGYPGSEGDPNKQGFDTFFGYNCQRMAHRYYPPYLWHNQEKVFLKGNDWTKTETYAPNEIQKATLQFIEQNKDTTFFAYIPFTLPHAELISPEDSISQKFKGKFKEPKPSGDYTSPYGKDIEFFKYAPQEQPRAAFATMVYRLDAYVGQIVNKLQELGIADNTLIIFTSDNGPHAEGGADPEFFNSAGGLKGIKRDMYEGGIRCPFIVVWPGKVKEGSRSDLISAFWDMMPTFADITQTPLTTATDGISLLPEFLGHKEQQKKHKYLYWEFPSLGGRIAVRMGQWKGVIYNLDKKPQGEFQLFDLSTDLAETKNVAKAHPEIVAQLKQIIKEAHTPSETFPLTDIK